MIGCCEVAVVGLVCHIIGLGIYAGYNIKIKAKEAQLEKRTMELEKKNGKELKEIAELRKEVAEIKTKQKNHEK
jgi:hypothetical protein